MTPSGWRPRRRAGRPGWPAWRWTGRSRRRTRRPADAGRSRCHRSAGSSPRRIEALGTLEPRERVVLTANAADRVTGYLSSRTASACRGKVLMTLVNEEENAQLESARATEANARAGLRTQPAPRHQPKPSPSWNSSAPRSAYDAAIGATSAPCRLACATVCSCAPFSGVLGFRQVSVGAYVSPGQAVATLIDDSQMRLEFGVPSIYLTDLRAGPRDQRHDQGHSRPHLRRQADLDRQRDRPGHAGGQGPRDPAEYGRRAESRHVDERAAGLQAAHVAVGLRNLGDRRRLQELRLRRRPVEAACRRREDGSHPRHARARHWWKCSTGLNPATWSSPMAC